WGVPDGARRWLGAGLRSDSESSAGTRARRPDPRLRRDTLAYAVPGPDQGRAAAVSALVGVLPELVRSVVRDVRRHELGAVRYDGHLEAGERPGDPPGHEPDAGPDSRRVLR